MTLFERRLKFAGGLISNSAIYCSSFTLEVKAIVFEVWKDSVVRQAYIEQVVWINIMWIHTFVKPSKR